MRELAELTTHCIRCGFCLEACPTFTTTASELESPRGRIYLVRSALEGRLKWQEDVREHLDLCLGCRACETACPSGVEYGAILEMARDLIEQERPQLAKSMLLLGTTKPGILKTQLAVSRMLSLKRVPSPLSKAISGEKAEADLPTPQAPVDLPPLDESKLPPIRGHVYFLEGCAMRVLYPRVHAASRRLLRRVGYAVKEVEQGCCGALHAHNGHLGEARKMADALIASMPERLPLIVNSAGCGSTIKDYAEIASDHEKGKAFAARSFDLSEFLVKEGLSETLASSPGFTDRVTYHDACHLAHGQKIRSAPRELIQSINGIEFVELVEADTCCGSAGIYNVTEPQMARKLLERKWGHVSESQATVVGTGNPGCHAWIAQAAREHGRSVSVLHTAELLEAAFVGLERFR